MTGVDVKVEAVVEIAKAAGVAIMEVYEREYEIIEKADGSPVTTADHRAHDIIVCLLYTSPSPRDQRGSRMPSSA